jgi:hypothetical protein
MFAGAAADLNSIVFVPATIGKVVEEEANPVVSVIVAPTTVGVAETMYCI